MEGFGYPSRVGHGPRSVASLRVSRRGLLQAAMVGAAGGMLAGCGTGSAGPGNGGASSGTLEYWYHWSTSDAPLEYHEEIAKDSWATDHPGLTLSTVRVPAEDRAARYAAAFAANDGPDLFTDTVAEYAALGIAAVLPDDLADRLAQEYVKPQDFRDGESFYGVAFEPIESVGLVLYINAEHFREAGLDPDQPPTSMSELREYAEALTVKDASGAITRSGFAHRIEGGALAFVGGKFLPWLHAYGGQLYDPAANTARGFADAPEAVEALKVLQQMTVGSQAVSSMTLGSADEQFWRGQASMIMRESGFLSAVEERAPELDMRISHVPPEKAEGCGEALQGWSLIANAQGQTDAAFDLMRAITTQEADLETAMRTQTLPAWRANWESDYMRSRLDYEAVQYSVANDPGLTYTGPNSSEALNAYGKHIQAVARGEADPTNAAAAAAEEIERILQQGQ